LQPDEIEAGLAVELLRHPERISALQSIGVSAPGVGSG
jgi:hypothetical protein